VKKAEPKSPHPEQKSITPEGAREILKEKIEKERWGTEFGTEIAAREKGRKPAETLLKTAA